MADNTSRGSRATSWQERAPLPMPQAGGDICSDEIRAVIVVVAILATAEGDDPRAKPDRPTGYPRPLWGSPGGMVRVTPPHGPAGWRASTFPR